jgi:hypothetical protein
MEALGVRRRIVYEPFSYEALRAAGRVAFGRDAIPDYRIEAARVLLSFGADFLETWLSNVRFARAWAEGIRSVRDGTRRGRFIHVEPRLSLTAANADEWVPIRPGTEAFLALAMIHVILAEGRAAPSLPADEVERLTRLVRPYDPETVAAQTDVPPDRIRRLARLFAEVDPALAIGGGVAGTGSNATATLVAIYLLNYVVGSIGRTVVFGPNLYPGAVGRFSELCDLIASMEAGQVEVLLLLDVNPVFTLPRSLGFESALAKVPLVVALTSFMVAMPAWPPVMPRTTFPSSARPKSPSGERWPGFGSSATSRPLETDPTSGLSRCCANTATVRPASRCVPSMRRTTIPRALTP